MKNQSTFFYSHLVEINPVFGELEDLNLNEDEKKELEKIAHVHIHQTIVETILSHLEEKDKKKFLELLTLGKDEKIWNHLNNKVEGIEAKIKAAADSVTKELTSDIREVK